MKKLKFLSVIFVALLGGCANIEDFPSVKENPIQNESHAICEKEAIDISRKVLGQMPRTRHMTDATPGISYVLNNERTRSVSAPDTLAYVITIPTVGAS